MIIEKKTIKLIMTIVVITSLVFLFRDKHYIFKQWDIEKLRNTIEGFGVWGMLVFIGITAIRPFLFFPNVVIFIVGGIIYGTILGSVAALVGVMIAFTLCFWLGSKFQGLFKRFVGENYIIKLSSLQEREIIRTFFIMRVTPAFPIDPISYGAGLVGIPYEKFFIGSLFGIAPKMIVYTFLGDAIDNIFSLQTIIAYLLLIILAIIPMKFFKKSL